MWRIWPVEIWRLWGVISRGPRGRGRKTYRMNVWMSKQNCTWSGLVESGMSIAQECM